MATKDRKTARRKPATSKATTPAKRKSSPRRTSESSETSSAAARIEATGSTTDAANLVTIDRYDGHRDECKAAAGELRPAWYVPPIATVVEDGATSLILRCNDALCDAAVGWRFRNILDVLEALVPDLGGAGLPGEDG